jgi:dihydrofolate synthase / folylpolyglutamate synthase
MIVNALKTHKITSEDKDIFNILDKYIDSLDEFSVVAITSKIISITEGSLVKINNDSGAEKEELVKQNSEYYLPGESNKYNVAFTVTNNILSASAGIDESNGNGYYILWPKDAQSSANKIREYLARRFNIRSVGVIITDSKTTPLRWGVTGIAISHSGFSALFDYIGKPDLFGRPFVYEKLNIADTLASAAVLEMGEGSEQTPLAVIKDIRNITFQDRNPTESELEELKIQLEDDLYSPFLSSVEWKKGGRG